VNRGSIGFSLTLLLILIASIILVVGTHRLMKPYLCISDSMDPIIKAGDHVLANSWIYKYDSIKRGDIIVVKHPSKPDKTLIKRIIGLSGESLQIVDHHLYINGVIFESKTIPFRRQYTNFSESDYGRLGQLIEIPENHYYLAGDNSRQSSDSRIWGTVPRKTILGKVSYKLADVPKNPQTWKERFKAAYAYPAAVWEATLKDLKRLLPPQAPSHS